MLIAAGTNCGRGGGGAGAGMFDAAGATMTCGWTPKTCTGVISVSVPTASSTRFPAEAK